MQTLPLHLEEFSFAKWLVLICYGKKACGKRGKCWLQAILPFPMMLSKPLSLKVVKGQDYMVMGHEGVFF